jgi:hypothetical protein
MAQTLEAVFYRGNDQNRGDFTPSGSSPGVGKVIDLGGDIGIVTSPEGLTDGKLGSVAKANVFKLKKAVGGGVTFAQSSKVFWDTVNFTAVAAAGANIIYAGIADEPAIDGDDHVKTDINKILPQVTTMT